MKTFVAFGIVMALCVPLGAQNTDWSKPVELYRISLTLKSDLTIPAHSSIRQSCINLNGHKLIFQEAGLPGTQVYDNNFIIGRITDLTDSNGDWRGFQQRIHLKLGAFMPCDEFPGLTKMMALMKSWIDVLAVLHLHPTRWSAA